VTDIDPLIAALAGRYRLDAPIGEGGMATVYRARDLRHDRDVALKVLRPELAAIIGAERFLAEIKVTANLQHPNILPLFDSGTVAGTVFYVMPLVDGESLRDRLDREKQLPIADAVRIAGEVALALDFAHRRGVIHRDVKPANILLHDGRALVADFGISLAAGSAGGRMTETGLSLGTPQYMSPEQAMGEREVTARADIYALGATLYEMLVGDPPFTGATGQAILGKVLTTAPTSIASQRRTVPPHVEAAVLIALEKLPADRFSTAAEFAAALNAGPPSAIGSTAARPELLQGGATRKGAVGRRGWLLQVAIGAVLLLVGASAGWATHRSSAPDSLLFERKTFQTMSIFNARVAPDGETIVMSAAAYGADPELMVIRPDYPRPQPMGQPHTHLLAISSKGELAVLVNATYLGHRFFKGTLASMAITGGAPRELRADVRDAAWSPDGEALAIVTKTDSVRLEYPIGTQRYATSGYISAPRISPDGRQIAFLEHASEGDDRGFVVVVDTLESRAKTVTPEYWGVEGLAWSLDGREVYYGSSISGSERSARAVTLDGDVRELTQNGSFTIMDRLPNGSLLLEELDGPIRMFAHVEGAPVDSEYSWLDQNSGPAISHDGRTVAFSDQSVTGGANYRVMLRHPDGRFSGLGEGLPIFYGAFSRDDRWIATRRTTAGDTVFLQPTGPESPRQVGITGVQQPVNVFGWYPDDRALLVCGVRTGDTMRRCYRWPIDGGSGEPVTGPSEGAALLSPDGSEVLVGGRRFTSATDTGRVVPGLLERLAPAGSFLVRWSTDGRSIFIYTAGFRVERIDAVSGRSELFADLTPARGSAVVEVSQVAVSDDERRYVYATTTYASTLFIAKSP
jgi:serine/threonine protein kinase/dipeptidyl aminopeptidase/acylaminoacyl peptidase